MKRVPLLWFTALGLGWLVDFLFWEHAPGINFAAYITICLLAALLALGGNGHWPSWKAALWSIPLLLFASVTFLREEPMSVFLAVLMTLFSAILLTMTYRGGRWMHYTLLDYLRNAFLLLGSLLARPLLSAIASYQEKKDRNPAGIGLPQRRSPWLAILRGIFLATPILLVFTGFLASADLIFAKRLARLIELFAFESLMEYIVRITYVLLIAYLLLGMFLHAAQKSGEEKVSDDKKPLLPPFLGVTEASIILASVVALFALFTVIQVHYLFGGEANIRVDGYTYAEYARRGFGELVAVAFLSLLLLLSLSAITKRQNARQQGWFVGLGCALVALVIAILASAFQRLLLYEAAYGFSRIRTYTHVFMIWLGGLLLAIMLLEILRKERFAALALVITMLGFSASLPLLNVDGFIVRQNVARAQRGEELDIPYLVSLSADAVPALVQAYRDPALSLSTRQAVGAALVCIQRDLSFRQSDPDWRSFTLPRYRRAEALLSVRESLNGYSFLNFTTVKAPNGAQYLCRRW